jgi:hypothetical protein
MPLPALESALQAWLREQLPWPADAGDISFDSPDGTWQAARTGTTVNLFLFDIARSARQPVLMPPRRGQGGALVQERPAPSVAFSFLLSVWGGGVHEEHRLLGEAVRSVLSTPRLDPGSESPQLVAPVDLAMAESRDARAGDLWSGLGARPRAGLVLVATMPVPLGRPVPVAPAVETVRAEVRRAGRAGPVGRASSAGPAGPLAANGTTPGRVSVEGSVIENDAPRRFVWFGPRQQRGRGRP